VRDAHSKAQKEFLGKFASLSPVATTRRFSKEIIYLSPVATIFDFLKPWRFGPFWCRIQLRRGEDSRDLSPVATISEIDDSNRPAERGNEQGIRCWKKFGSRHLILGHQSLLVKAGLFSVL
jgi:hypothetical protein